LSSKLDDLKNLFNDKRDLAAGNAKLKSKLVLQELVQNKKLQEFKAKNHELEKILKVAHDKLTERKSRNRESKILLFASAIVEKCFKSLVGDELSQCHSKTLPVSTYIRESLERLCDDMKEAQLSIIDVLEYETEREPLKQLLKDSSAKTEDTIKDSMKHASSWRKTMEDFQLKMLQNFKQSDRGNEAVASTFLVKPIG